LARTLDEAMPLAARTGYPVALKAQAAALTHKTEAGGVVLGIQDETALRAAWASMTAKLAGVTLDGLLVEKMAPKGLELVVGARRDPRWGPVLLVGLGGIWVEALGDVRLLAADAEPETIVEELRRLRSARLLSGFRGAPAVDIDAVAAAVSTLGRLMLGNADIVEVDVNPLLALPEGRGVMALDALIVTRQAAHG
jgi:acyl-CoA synthetase (NDP forming)